MTERKHKAQKYFDKGQEAMKLKDYEGAAAWFAALIEYEPLDKEAQELFQKASVLHAQKDFNALKKIGYSILGNLLVSFSPKSATHYIGVLSANKPQDPKLAATYGRCLMASDQPGLAAVAFRRALNFLPGNKGILKAAGPAFEAVDDKPGAIEVYSQLAKFEPGQGKWAMKVKDISAVHYGDTGGITDLKSARSEDEKKAAELQTKEGKLERIKELLHEYNQDKEANAPLLRDIGRLFLSIESWDRALNIWSKIYEADEADEEAAANIAKCYAKMGEMEKAKERYLELHEAHPLDPRYCDSYYEIQLQEVDDQLEESPEDEELIEKKEALKKDHIDKKVEIYKELSKKRAGDVETLLEYALLLEKQGSTDEAIPVFQKVSQSPARALIALHHLGWLFIEKKQLTLAVDTFKRALEKIPQSKAISTEKKDLWFGLGEAYQKDNNIEEAKEWYKKVYENDIEFRDIRERYEALLS
ncbi:MAG: tetratricopeptide repeat protein [Candidatus Omnitrophica bacterium]|nr:tetratricopeptide repeat protein [Candidatus Omnitrophota bacterium]MCA9435553.1 tetratricopeptide repeat protein [Candidatus Omnitrophota bacterium]MCA9448381.1 tetratricopeptide repeat protein [Candidatus Omnitrophota bacterium]MCB9770386.1 tetratricopeptide repeat protein [Candidatus Omnitrophota bacterium]